MKVTCDGEHFRHSISIVDCEVQVCSSKDRGVASHLFHVGCFRGTVEIEVLHRGLNGNRYACFLKYKGRHMFECTHEYVNVRTDLCMCAPVHLIERWF